MKESVEQIEKLAPIIEARISRGERENAETERRLAGIERAEAKKERLEAKAWREEQKVDLQCTSSISSFQISGKYAHASLLR